MLNKLFSHSKINTYLQCPRKYKLQYIDKIKIPEGAQSIEGLMGSCVHEALKQLYQDLEFSKLLTFEEIKKLYLAQWDTNLNNQIIIPKQGLSSENFRDSGLSMLRQYYHHYAPFDQSKTIALEKKIQFPLLEYQMIGYIDRLGIRDDGVYEIHDYKTSSSYPTKADIDNDRQLSLYQLGIKSIFLNVQKVVLIWHFLKQDQEISITRSDEELIQITKDVVAWIRKMEHDPSYQPNESPLCAWCFYVNYCPAKAHELDILSYSSSEVSDGVQIVDEYWLIQKQINELTARKSELESILSEIESKAIEFALHNEYSKLVGHNCALQIIDEWSTQFPKSNEKGRIELETWFKEKKLWDQVSILQLPRVNKLIKSETLSLDLHNELMEFSQMQHLKKVKLVKNNSDFVENDESENSSSDT